MTKFKHHITVGKQMYVVCGEYEMYSYQDITSTSPTQLPPVVTYKSIKLLGGYKELVDTIPEDVLGFIDIVVREKIGEGH